MKHVARVSAVALLLAIFPGCSALDGKSCTAVACISGVAISLEVPYSVDMLDGTRLEVCKNDRCAFASVHVETEKNASSSSSFPTIRCAVTVTQGGRVDCNELRVGGASVHFAIAFSVVDVDDLQDGDRFDVRLTDASASATLAEKHATVATYRTDHPDACNEDYFCRHTTL